MRTINYGSGDVRIHCQEITQHIYAKAFDYRDMTQDVLGGISFDGTTEIDLNSLNFAAIHRALWAMIKTANPGTTQGFEAWCNTQGVVDLTLEDENGNVPVSEVIEELVSCMFPSASVRV